MPAITDRTRKSLWGRSAGMCSICRKQLFDDDERPNDPTVLGQECHIVGEENAQKSPRGINSMALSERNLFGNLILLCQDHHKIIDEQTGKYTIDELHKIKIEHLVWVRQTLGFDEAKMLDDEEYLSIAQKWSELAGIDHWSDFTLGVIAGDSPSVELMRLKDLDTLQDWLFTRVYPLRYPKLRLAFQKFRIVLQDFKNIFRKHSLDDPTPDGDIRTEKFYNFDGWDEERYNRLAKMYDDHVALLQDLALEMTRAANYICDEIREHVYRRYRVTEGVLVAETGIGMDGVYRTVRVSYSPEELTDRPYPGLKIFDSVRCKRDFHYGPPSE